MCLAKRSVKRDIYIGKLRDPPPQKEGDAPPPGAKDPRRNDERSIMTDGHPLQAPDLERTTTEDLQGDTDSMVLFYKLDGWDTLSSQHG